MANLRLSLEIIAATQKAAANVKAFVATVVSGSKEATAAGNQGEAFTSIRDGARKASDQVRKLAADVAQTTAQARGRYASEMPTNAAIGTTRNTPLSQSGPPANAPSIAATGQAKNRNSSFQNIPASLNDSIAQVGERIKALSPLAAQAGEGMTRGFSRMKVATESISVQLDRLQKGFALFYAAQGLLRGVGSIVSVADAYGQLQARIKLAAGEGANYAAISRQVMQVAQDTRTPLLAVADLYARMAPGLREIGQGNSEIIATTRTIGQLLTVSGTSGPAAAGALNQFAQALGAGALRGDEFNSVNEQAPAIMQAVADGLGVPRAALRKYAEDGKLTTEFVTRALASQADQIEARFAAMPKTVAGSFQQVKNAFSKVVGDLNTKIGATGGIANVFTTIANNMQAVLGAAFAALAGSVGLGIVKLVQHVQASNLAAAASLAERTALIAKAQTLVATANAENMAAVATLRRAEAASAAGLADGSLAVAQARVAATSATQTAAQNALTAATLSTGAALSAGSRLLSALGGPVGIAITALTALAGWWFTVGKNADSAREAQSKAFAATNRSNQQTLLEGGTPTADALKAQGKLIADAERALGQSRAALMRRNGQLVQSEENRQRQQQVESDEAVLFQARETFARMAAERTKAAEEANKVQRDFKAFAAGTSKKDQSDKEAKTAQKAAEELARQREAATESESRYQDAIEESRIKLLELTGQTKEARIAELERQAAPGIIDAGLRGDPIGQEQLRTVLKLQIEQVEIEGFEAETTKALDAARQTFERQRDTLNVQVEIGDISQNEGKAKLREAQRTYLEVVAGIEQRLNAAPDLIPAEKLETFKLAITEIKAQFRGLDDPLREFKSLLGSILQDGLAKSLTDIANGTKSIGGAFKNLGSTIVRELQAAAIKNAVNAMVSYVQTAFASIAATSGGAGGGGGGLGGLIKIGAGLAASYFGGAGSVKTLAPIAPLSAGATPAMASLAPLGRFAKGGAIRGPGTGTSDSIPALLSNGEFVLRAEAVKRIGINALDRLNDGRGVARFAAGGLVGKAIGPRSSAADGGSLTINVSMPVDARSATDPGQIALIVANAQAALRKQLALEYRRRQGAFS